MSDSWLEPPFNILPKLGDLSGFPKLGSTHYLNHAAITPPSQWVKESLQQVLDDFASRGSGAFLDVVEARIALKAQLATLLGAPSADGTDFAWCPNTTSGVQAIAHAFPWDHQRGLLVFDGEFPTNVIPWTQVAKRHRLVLHSASLTPLMAIGGADWAQVESILKQGIQLVAISAVQFQTGFKVPLAELSALCKRYDAALFVDGIQACGSTPIPLDLIDFMACGGHKWMMAVEGAGFLYVHPRWHGRLVPQQAGWLSVEEPLDFLFAGHSMLRHDKPLRQDLSAFEGGAQSALCYAALEASTNILNTFGVEVIFEHIQALLDPLEQGLVARGFHSARLPDLARRGCSLSVRPPTGDPRHVAHWSQSLHKHGVIVSIPDGWLRFSPHWPNHIGQITTILDVIDDLLSKPALSPTH
jgi:cysteine desulfurase / selenocysteine lyase